MATDPQITAEQFMDLPLSGPEQYELVRGEVQTMTPPGSRHGALCAWVTGALIAHVRAGDLGAVFTQSGFKIDSSPDTVRAPDVAFVTKARLPEGTIPVGALELAPDLAVEVVSPSDNYTQLQEKIADYLKAGTRVALVVDPTSCSVTVHRGPKRVETLHAGDVFEGGDVVPGWRLDIADVFDAWFPTDAQ